jgi:hypothetical protein
MHAEVMALSCTKPSSARTMILQLLSTQEDHGEIGRRGSGGVGSKVAILFCMILVLCILSPLRSTNLSESRNGIFI